MINISITADFLRIFMNKLLKEDLFDTFEVRGIELLTLTRIELSGIYNKKFLQTENIKNFCTWKELKNIVFELIKGTKKPSYFKIVFSYPENLITEISKDAKALFLNIYFENNSINISTATSQINFSLDKSLDHVWDEYIINFLKINQILFQNN